MIIFPPSANTCNFFPLHKAVIVLMEHIKEFRHDLCFGSQGFSPKDNPPLIMSEELNPIQVTKNLITIRAAYQHGWCTCQIQQDFNTILRDNNIIELTHPN